MPSLVVYVLSWRGGWILSNVFPVSIERIFVLYSINVVYYIDVHILFQVYTPGINST